MNNKYKSSVCKMKKNGFISMTLLYSFFLLFILLMGILLSSYSTNRTLKKQYTNKIEESLIDKTFYPVELVTDGNKHDRRGKDGLSDNDTDKGMYRYQGTNTEVNNYICIGSDCSDDENIYRIIGIARDGRMKVIKMGLSKNKFKLKDSIYSDLGWYWDTQYNDWKEDTGIRAKLNNTGADYYLSTLGDYKNYIDSSGDSKFYSFETPISTSPEEPINYILSYPFTNTTATNLYVLETKGEIASYGADKVDDEGYSYKVGLMQISDYYLAAGDSANCSESGEYSTCKASWIYFNNEGVFCEWTASREDGMFAWVVYSGKETGEGGCEDEGGCVQTRYIDNSHGYCGARPVFYLKAKILLEGSGTKDDPYIIVGESNE